MDLNRISEARRCASQMEIKESPLDRLKRYAEYAIDPANWGEDEKFEPFCFKRFWEKKVSFRKSCVVKNIHAITSMFFSEVCESDTVSQLFGKNSIAEMEKVKAAFQYRISKLESTEMTRYPTVSKPFTKELGCMIQILVWIASNQSDMQALLNYTKKLIMTQSTSSAMWVPCLWMNLNH